MFHSQEAADGFVEALVAEISRSDHWLEGARIKEHLSGACLSGARLPGATFEGRTLRGVVLDNALLEGANFRSSHLEDTSLYGSNLRGAAFDLATLQEANSPVDLRNAELGGASFSGATLVSPRIFGSRFSEPTSIERFLDAPIFEMAHGSWDEAAVVYSALAKRASEDWDFSSEEIAAYLAMTCKHRKALGGPPGSLPGAARDRSSHVMVGE
ncbi:MAG: pentapeptide repeat-containing protein [Actinomycetota bacterium]